MSSVDESQPGYDRLLQVIIHLWFYPRQWRGLVPVEGCSSIHLQIRAWPFARTIRSMYYWRREENHQLWCPSHGWVVLARAHVHTTFQYLRNGWSGCVKFVLWLGTRYVRCKLSTAFFNAPRVARSTCRGSHPREPILASYTVRGCSWSAKKAYDC